jgi:hypothetical protein
MQRQTSAAEQVSTAPILKVYTATPAPRSSLLFASSSRISAKDAIDLRWRFTNPPLVGVPEAGFSGQLERLAVFSFGVRPCTKCGGTSRGEGRDGTGFVPAGLLAKRTYAQAYRQFLREEAARQGRAIISQTSAELLALISGPSDEWGAPVDASAKVVTLERMRELFPRIPEELCRQCPNCKGDGNVPRKTRSRTPITVRPTGSSVDGDGTAPSVSVDVVGLVRYGKISRLLERVAAASLLARVLIEVYYSEGGGSVDALWEFTQSGRALFKRLPNPRALPAQALFENERAAQRESPTEERRLALGRVDAEANQEWDAACRAWNEAVRA